MRRRLVCGIPCCDSQGAYPVPVEDSPGFVENALLCPGSPAGLNEGLMKAVEAGWTRAVTALLDGGASPQASLVGASAVPASQRLLASAGASVWLPTIAGTAVSSHADDLVAQKDGTSALLVACTQGHVECVRALLDRGAGMDGPGVSWPRIPDVACLS